VPGLFDQVKKLANSEQGEKVTDKLLDTVSDIASKRTGGKHDAQIDQARKAADKALGREEGRPPKQ
jgi:phage terminase small subunit